jgi:hypothetical protein
VSLFANLKLIKSSGVQYLLYTDKNSFDVQAANFGEDLLLSRHFKDFGSLVIRHSQKQFSVAAKKNT